MTVVAEAVRVSRWYVSMTLVLTDGLLASNRWYEAMHNCHITTT